MNSFVFYWPVFGTDQQMVTLLRTGARFS